LSPDFANDLKHRRSLVDSALSQTLERHGSSAPSALIEAMRYSLMAPGKRLRPMLVMLACQALGGTDEQALPAACAVEMVHTYSLIHDDLPAMDDDDLRRGLPTCHKKFGEAMAILAGDALLTLAFQVLATSYNGDTAAVTCLELALGSGAAGMVGGQVLDLTAENRLPTASPLPMNLDTLEGIHRRKTGALYRSSLRMGYHAAQRPNPHAMEQLDTFGRMFGLAFQITDDLLDVEGSSVNVGKKTGKDAERGKLTYPGLLGVVESRRRAVQLCEDAVAAVRDLGPAAEPLAQLARFVVERDR